MNIRKLNRKLKDIDPRITAEEKDGCVFLRGHVDDWQKAVRAGRLAVNRKKYLGVINDIQLDGFEQKQILPEIQDDLLEGRSPDVLIIGGGITGCAAARELSRYNLDVLLVEKGPDLASGQSSRNGGVVHVGINFSAHSQKFIYNLRGSKAYPRVSEELGVPFERKGQITYAYKKWELPVLWIIMHKGRRMGITDLKMMSPDELRQYEPSVPEWACGGLFMGTGGITSPHRMTIALGENAAENGAQISLNTAVTGMEVVNDRILSVSTNRGTIRPKAVINASGVWADVIAEMAHDRTFTIHPRKGTDIVMDVRTGHMVNSSFGKTPFTLTPKQRESIGKDPVSVIKATIENLHSHSKGIGMIHSIDGNMLIGPNADEVPDREDMSTDRRTVERIIAVQQEVSPLVDAKDVIAYFTGVRSPVYEEDFVVRKGIHTENIFEAAGIQSPGVTASLAIAEDLAAWTVSYLRESGMDVQADPSFNPIRKKHPVPREMSPEERDALIRSDPAYGQIVCRCEEVSKGEIRDAMRSPVPVYTTDGIKRRVRPGMGRCQGGFCLPLVMAIIAAEKGMDLAGVKKGTEKSWIVRDRFPEDLKKD